MLTGTSLNNCILTLLVAGKNENPYERKQYGFNTMIW